MSKRVVIPIGPQHPALKEPGSFIITLEGEKVVGAQVEVGYNHRGIEKACESRTYIQNLYIIERVCGICSHAHSTAYLQAIEELAGVAIPRRAAYIRSIMGELERLHSHLLWLGVAGHEIGFDTLFMYAWRDRELVLDVLAMLGGNRVNYGINTPGGVRRDIDPEHIQKIRDMVDIVEERNKYYINLALGETTLHARLGGVGRLSHEEVIKFGAVGPVARAAGVAFDVRQAEPYAAYDEAQVKVITDDHADVFGRTVVRVLEIMESIRLLRFLLDNLPEGEIVTKMPRRIPAGETVSRYEAPRGEDVHYVCANGTDILERIRVRAPTEANWHGMSHMLENDYLADVSIIIAAIDPCYSCTDRAIVIDNRDSGQQTIFDWKQLRQYSIDWYRNRGVDPAKLANRLPRL
ncbi:MAG: nickel-dependent hydrogenase large subunit [Clostridiales bacterium]|jgi:NADH-quinone oxidoreductase subunit D|nr:nickel-dependent hydrogenase large subunit [Clostridiales bacterium]